MSPALTAGLSRTAEGTPSVHRYPSLTARTGPFVGPIQALLFNGLSQKDEVGQDCLGKEDGRNAEVKLPFLCLVVKEIHAHKCADAATYDGHPDEGSLRYAPLPPAGLPFVNPEDQEGQDIDDDEIYEQCSHGPPGVAPIKREFSA